jgi:hypothetical protein
MRCEEKLIQTRPNDSAEVSFPHAESWHGVAGAEVDVTRAVIRLELLPVIQAAAFESSRSRCVFDLKPFLLPKSRQLDYFRYADLNEAALRRTLSRAEASGIGDSRLGVLQNGVSGVTMRQS